MTIRPERSLSLACLANSSAASKLFFKAVSSIFLSLVDLPELTSTATKASVWSIIMYPPDFSVTLGLKISCSCASRLYL